MAVEQPPQASTAIREQISLPEQHFDQRLGYRLGQRPFSLPGRFISFEGGVGVGKTTQMRLLADWLGQQPLEVCCTREPGGSPRGEAIRELLIDGDWPSLNPLTEALLYYASRCDHMEEVVYPAMAAGQWVLCDRFQDSTQAIQSATFGLDQKVIDRLRSLVLGDFTPDLTLILDAHHQVCRRRLALGRKHRYRRMDESVHQRIRESFLEIAAKEQERCVVIDAEAECESVHHQIVEQVELRLGRGQLIVGGFGRPKQET